MSAEAHYEKFERSCMAQEDVGKYYHYPRSFSDNKEGNVTVYRNTIHKYPEDEPLPEDRPMEIVLAYGLDPSIEYSIVEKENPDTQRFYTIYKKHNEFTNVFYIRFVKISEGYRYCDGCGFRGCRSRYCRGGYSYEEGEISVYNFILSIRNYTEAKIVHNVVCNYLKNVSNDDNNSEYYSDYDDYNFDISKVANILENNKQNIKKEGKRLYKEICNLFLEEVLDHIALFL